MLSIRAMRLCQDQGYSLLEIMLVMMLTVTVAAIAIPMSANALGNFRLSGDARSVSNAVALAKMRAASGFSKARLYVDLSAKRHHIEIYQKTGPPGWVWEGGATSISQGVTIGYGALASPPPSTQSTLAQAPSCLDSLGAVIANTACVVFNSRGIPVDATGAPTVSDAIYLTDGTAVYGTTVIATGTIQLWRSGPTTAAWTKQ